MGRTHALPSGNRGDGSPALYSSAGLGLASTWLEKSKCCLILLQVFTLHEKTNCSCKPKVHFPRGILFHAAGVELLSEILAMTCLMCACSCCVAVLNAVKKKYRFTVISVKNALKHGWNTAKRVWVTEAFLSWQTGSAMFTDYFKAFISKCYISIVGGGDFLLSELTVFGIIQL